MILHLPIRCDQRNPAIKDIIDKCICNNIYSYNTPTPDIVDKIESDIICEIRQMRIDSIIFEDEF